MPPPDSPAPRPVPWRALGIAGILAAVFLAVLWPKIASGTLWFHDELLSGNRAREILLRHDPLTITINFKPDFKKPPLQYWLEAVFLLLTTNRELAIRLPSLIYGALCLPATVFLAWTVSRRRAWADSGFLALPAVTVAAFGSFVHYSRIGLLDTGTAFYLALALAGCQLARNNPRWWWFVGGCCWLGGWQKAPYALAAWLLVLVLRRFREPATANLCSRQLWGALLAAILLIGTWYSLQFIRHDDAVILNAGQEQATSLWRGHDPESAGFMPQLYWWWLIRDWAFIGLLAPIAVVWTVLKGWRREDASPRLEVAAFCAVYGFVLAVTPFRVERYLTAMVPLLAVVTVDWLAESLERFGFAPVTRRVLLAALVALSFPVACFHYLKPPRGGPETLLTAAQELRDTLKPEETVLIDEKADPDFNTISFIIFYAELHRPAQVLSVDKIQQRLSHPNATSYRGIEHSSFLQRLLDANPRLEIVSRHGDWVLWHAPGTNEVLRATVQPSDQS